MWMSTSATSTASPERSARPSRPFAASPTTTLGSSVARSPSTSFMRSRAGCSSSTRNTRKGAAALIVRPLGRDRFAGHRLRRRLAVGQGHPDLVVRAGLTGRELGLDVEVELESLPDVGERDPVPLPVLVLWLIRVRELHVHPVPVAPDRDLDRAALRPRLDPVIHRILDERLQEERRHERVARRLVDLPFDREPVAEP